LNGAAMEAGTFIASPQIEDLMESDAWARAWVGEQVGLTNV